MTSELNSDRRFRVLIVNSERWLALARLPRILARAGCTVEVFGAPRVPVSRSGWVSRFIEAPGDSAGFVEKLEEFLAAEGDAFDWVILADDPLLGILRSRVSEAWIDPFLPFEPRGQVLSVIGSKSSLFQVLKDADLPMPDWRTASSLEEATAAAEAVGFPVILKPDNCHAGFGVCKASDPAQLQAAYEHAAEFDQMVVIQRFIEGKVGLTEALMFEGRPVAWITSFKECTSPGPFGASSARRFFVHPETEPYLTEFAEAIGYHGFAGFDFILNEESNELFFIEFNLRPTPGLLLGPMMSVDFSRAVREMLAGEPTVQRPRPNSSTFARLFPEDVVRIVQEDDYRSLPGLLFNRNTWRSVPFGDWRLIRPYLGQIYAALRHRLSS